MHEISWWFFIATSPILTATPGQDMILVMSRSVARGAAAGVATAAGVSVGPVGHPVLAALGLGAILRTRTTADAAAACARPHVRGLTFVVKAPVGSFAGALSGSLRRRPSVLVWLYRSSGVVLLGLGVRLAFERRN